MRKSFLILLVILGLGSQVGDVFASATCPPPPPPLNLDQETLRSEAIDHIERCIAARAQGKESTIKDFVCPSGDFNISDRPMVDQILAYQLTVAVVFQKIDQNSNQYMQSLLCLRDRDPLKWDATNNARINGQQYQSPESYEYLYKSYCTDFSRIPDLINTDTKKYILTSDTYPQYFDCMALAEKKIEALRILGGFLTTNGIAKGYENDKDVFVDQVKTKYTTLLEKTSRYFRLIAQAVSKMDTYLKQTIQ